MDTKKQIVSALKELGYNSRKVSVKNSYPGYEQLITLTVRDCSVDISAVKKLANEYVSVSRCERSGEVLMGGNTYVDVNITDEVLEELGKPYIDTVTQAVEKIKSNDDFCGVQLAEGIHLFKSHSYSNGFELKINQDFGSRVFFNIKGICQYLGQKRIQIK